MNLRGSLFCPPESLQEFKKYTDSPIQRMKAGVQALNKMTNYQPGMGTTDVVQPPRNVALLSRTTLTGGQVSAGCLRDGKLITLCPNLSQVQGIHSGMLFLAQFNSANIFLRPYPVPGMILHPGMKG